MSGYIPDSDAKFDEWMDNFARYIAENGEAMGLSEEQIGRVQDVNTNWHNGYTTHIESQAKAKADTATKKSLHDIAEQTARATVRLIQALPGVTDAQKLKMLLNVPDDTRTVASETDILTLKTPLVHIEFGQRGLAIIHFGPNPQNERQNGKPEGVAGFKIQYAIGGVPETEDGWRYLDDDTASPYVHKVASPVPVTIAYRVAYFDRQMRLGPWSDPVTVTITP